MAERRMFAKTIVLSDAFLDMPMSARCLYFTLGMLADDDGFVNQPKSIMRQCGASEDDMKLLIAKKYVLVFESGVIVIKHWRINNYLRNDRYKETVYKEEASQLTVKDNGSYTLGIPNSGIPSIGKDSIGKDSIGNSSKRFTPPTLEEVQAYCTERNNNVDAQRFIDYYESNGWKVGKNKMKDWKAAVRTWERSGYDNKPKKNNVVIPMPDYIRKQIEQSDREREARQMDRDSLLKEIDEMKGDLYE